MRGRWRKLLFCIVRGTLRMAPLCEESLEKAVLCVVRGTLGMASVCEGSPEKAAFLYYERYPENGSSL